MGLRLALHLRIVRLSADAPPCSSHFLLHFDTNPRVLATLTARLRADPRVIKYTALKLGEKLDEITPKAELAGSYGLLESAVPSGGTINPPRSSQ